jgi:hypothetical protein
MPVTITVPEGATVHYVRFAAAEWACGAEGPGYATALPVDVTCAACAVDPLFLEAVALLAQHEHGLLQARFGALWQHGMARPVHAASAAVGLLEEAVFLCSAAGGSVSAEWENWQRRTASFLRSLLA